MVELVRDGIMEDAANNSQLSESTASCLSESSASSLSVDLRTLSIAELFEFFESCPAAPGVLDEAPCSLEAYFLIPRKFGHYELWDSVLTFVSMVNDAQHTKQANFLKSRFDLERSKFEERETLECVLNCSLGEGSTARCLEGDLVIGNMNADPSKPACSKASLVVEITSSNRKNDWKVKMKRYAEMKIPEYIIIDRKTRSIRGFKLHENTYSPNGIWKGCDRFRHQYFGSFLADELMDVKEPQNLVSDTLISTIKDARKEKEERKKAEEKAMKWSENVFKLKEQIEQLRKQLVDMSERNNERVPSPPSPVPSISDSQSMTVKRRRSSSPSNRGSSSDSPPKKK